MVIVTTKKWHYQFRNETHVKKYSNGDDIEAEIDFGDDPGLASRFLEGEEKMVLSLVDGNEEVADEMSPLFLVFKPMIGKMLEDGYEPGPEDYRITLKVFGNKEERRALAFVGRAQLSPAGDRDLTADELEEGMGKDVTSCVDFKEFKIYLGKHPEGWTTEKGKKSRRSGSKKALALRIATPLQGKEKPLYGQIIASRLRSLNLDHSAEVVEDWKKRFRKDHSGLAFHVAKLKVTLGGASAYSDKLNNKKDSKTRSLHGFRLTGSKKFCQMGREITFELNEPADEKVTRANFTVQVQNQYDIFILNDVELKIYQKFGLVKKESWEAAIRQALHHSRESSSQSGSSSKCLIKMQLVRHDPPDQSDWEELFIYEHAEDDCLLCDIPTAETRKRRASSTESSEGPEAKCHLGDTEPGAVLEEYLVPSLPVTNITMSPITDGAVGLTEVNSLGIGIETGQSIELLSDPMLGQMPNPQMIAAPQMATAATVDQEQDLLDYLLKEGVELEDIMADPTSNIEVQPDGGGGDSGGAPPPSLDLRTEGRHNVWDEEDVSVATGPIVDQSMAVPDAQPEPSVLSERHLMEIRETDGGPANRVSEHLRAAYDIASNVLDTEVFGPPRYRFPRVFQHSRAGREIGGSNQNLLLLFILSLAFLLPNNLALPNWRPVASFCLWRTFEGMAKYVRVAYKEDPNVALAVRSIYVAGAFLVFMLWFV